jgi:hypothetical protein
MQPAPVDPTRLLRQSDTILTNELAPDEVLMMDIDQAKYFGLRGTSAVIWSRFAQPSTIDDVVASLLPDYEVDEATCRAETKACVEEMVQRTLLVAV